MKKLLSSIILTITAMLLCCGCGYQGAAEPAETYPENYAPEEQEIEPVKITRVVKATPKRDNNRKYNDKNCIKFIDGYYGTYKGIDKSGDENSSTGFVVKYSFTNIKDSARDMSMAFGKLEGYQNGVRIDSECYGEHNEYTEILPGSTIELTKVFETSDFEEPVEIIAEDFIKEVYYHAVLTTEKKAEEKMINSPYTVKIENATIKDTGYITVDHSFTNTEDQAVTPAHVYAVQAYQGDKQLSVAEQSLIGGGKVGHLKDYKVEPGQKADLFTTFRLNNSEEDVTVYLTVPATAEIFDKETYNMN